MQTNLQRLNSQTTPFPGSNTGILFLCPNPLGAGGSRQPEKGPMPQRLKLFKLARSKTSLFCLFCSSPETQIKALAHIFLLHLPLPDQPWVSSMWPCMVCQGLPPASSNLGVQEASSSLMVIPLSACSVECFKAGRLWEDCRTKPPPPALPQESSRGWRSANADSINYLCDLAGKHLTSLSFTFYV